MAREAFRSTANLDQLAKIFLPPLQNHPVLTIAGPNTFRFAQDQELISEIEGVAGIHVMAYRQEEFVNEIIHASGVMKNRKPRQVGAMTGKEKE